MTERLNEAENWVRMGGVSRRAALGGGAAALGYALAAQPVRAERIVTPTDGLVEGMLTFPTTDGLAMNAYRARPAGTAKAPVVLVVQEIFGVHEWIRDVTRRLARSGYYAIAPDLYQRQGDPTKQADFRKLISEIVAKVPDGQVMADLDRAAAFAGDDGGDGASVQVTGFCWGGRITWLYAAHNAALKSGVAWYGRLTGEASDLQPKHPIDLVSQLKAPVLGLYGDQDRGIPVADVERMNAALKAAKNPGRLHLFEGADHGFLADYRPSFNEAAARAGWQMMLDWFQNNR